MLKPTSSVIAIIHVRIWIFWRNLSSLVILSFRLLFFDIRSQNSDLIVFMFLKIKPKFFSKPQLQKVVIQRFLRYANLLSSIFQRVPQQVTLIILNSIIELPPEANLLNNILNRTFLCPFLLSICWHILGLRNSSRTIRFRSLFLLNLLSSSLTSRNSRSLC